MGNVEPPRLHWAADESGWGSRDQPKSRGPGPPWEGCLPVRLLQVVPPSVSSIHPGDILRGRLAGNLKRGVVIVTDDEGVFRPSRVLLVDLEGSDSPVPIPMTEGIALTTTVAISSEGDLIATGHFDGTVLLWNARFGAGPSSFRVAGGKIGSLSFSTDSNDLILAADDGSVEVWETSPPRRRAALGGLWSPPWAVCLTSNGTRAAAATPSGEILVWDLPRSGKGSTSGPSLRWNAVHGTEAVPVYPDRAERTEVAVGGKDRGVRPGVSPSMDVQSESQDSLTSTGFHPHLSFLPDGRHLLVAGLGGPAKVLAASPDSLFDQLWSRARHWVRP